MNAKLTLEEIGGGCFKTVRTIWTIDSKGNTLIAATSSTMSNCFFDQTGIT